MSFHILARPHSGTHILGVALKRPKQQGPEADGHHMLTLGGNATRAT